MLLNKLLNKNEQLELTIGQNVKGVPTLTVADVVRAVSDVLAVTGFTVIPCRGVWQGEEEDSLRVEIVANKKDITGMVSRVPELCNTLQQDAIMLKRGDSVPIFVS